MVEAHNKASTVTLELLDELKDWCISLIFHTSLIQLYKANNDVLFPHCEAKVCWGIYAYVVDIVMIIEFIFFHVFSFSDWTLSHTK